MIWETGEDIGSWKKLEIEEHENDSLSIEDKEKIQVIFYKPM